MRRLASLVPFLLVVIWSTSVLSQATDATYTVGNLKIVHPWTRVVPDGSKVAAGYMSITNTGSEPDRLTGGSFLISGNLEVHEMKMEGGTMKMRALHDGLEIPPGKSVLLRPGSYHLMFLDLKQAMKAGERIKGTLTFAKAGTVEVEYLIERLGAQTSGPHPAPKSTTDAPKKSHSHH